VGWAAASHKRAKLVLNALQMALWRRDLASQVQFHERSFGKASVTNRPVLSGLAEGR
jgi:transposase InsO family protein